VNLWIRNRSKPTRDNIVLIEDELGIEPRGQLLGLAGYSINGTPAEHTVESMIRADPGLDPEDKRVLLRLLLLARERRASQAG
jgi:hypothetical protein